MLFVYIYIVFTFPPGDPCLSFEVLEDSEGRRDNRYPVSSYLLGGTQAEAGHLNYILLMKMYNLHRTQKKTSKATDDSEDDEESDDDDEQEMSDEENEDKTPQLRQTYIKHNGCVNRIKVHVVLLLL